MRLHNDQANFLLGKDYASSQIETTTSNSTCKHSAVNQSKLKRFCKSLLTNLAKLQYVWDPVVSVALSERKVNFAGPTSCEH